MSRAPLTAMSTLSAALLLALSAPAWAQSHAGHATAPITADAPPADGGSVDHSQMDHSTMDHAAMGHGTPKPPAPKPPGASPALPTLLSPARLPAPGGAPYGDGENVGV